MFGNFGLTVKISLKTFIFFLRVEAFSTEIDLQSLLLELGKKKKGKKKKKRSKKIQNEIIVNKRNN